MQQLLAFAAALVTFRLAGRLAARWRERRAPELAAWTFALLAYALACAALAWGAAAGWDARVFRVYYLFGGLLSAPLLGVGSLLLLRRRWAVTVGHVYTWAAVGVAIAVPVTHKIEGHAIPSAQAHLDFFPARLLALIGNSLGTLAVVSVALLTIRRRPLGNALIVAGVAVAAIGSATPQLTHAQLQRKLDRYRHRAWRWQRVMERPLTLTLAHPPADPFGRIRVWKRISARLESIATHPPHLRAWTCIHRYEGSWTDTSAPYYGGLQMDLGFQRHYGAALLARKGTANYWTPLEQMWVAERALNAGRGFWPWPNTARMCGLL